MDASPLAKFEIIHETITSEHNIINISELCKMAGISRSGYYKWLASKDIRLTREQQDELDFQLILDAFKYRGYTKGARSIHMRLLHSSPQVIMNVKKIRRLMQKFNLVCPVRRPNPHRRIAKAMQTSRVAPNLLNREFKAFGARKVLLTDITYIPRYSHKKDGVLKYSYVSIIMDAYTKQVLACTCSSSLEVDFVLSCVNILMRDFGNELATDALIHSDQGCHYTSTKFIKIINDNKLRQSMSRRGNCWDNAPQESFFGHMKAELSLIPSDTHHQIERKVLDWIDYYNNDRYQWRLSKLTPNQFYEYTKTGVYPI